MSEVKKWHMPRGTSVSEGEDGEFVLASDYGAIAAECERLRGEVSDLHTTMMAAAVEIQGHWAAHCDEEGYGPANLMHRLEHGIASQYGYNAETVVRMEAQRDAALAELAALKGGQAKDETHAQPEVAQNTGSQAMANNQLQRQGRAAGHGVEAVAAVNEASEASDIFAWATFDGEGSYELRLYENNESYQDEWLARESAKYAGWVFPLYTSPPAQASAWPEGAARSDTWLEKWARDKFNSTGRYKGRVYGNTDWALARALHTAMLAAAPTPGASDGKGGDHE